MPQSFMSTSNAVLQGLDTIGLHNRLCFLCLHFHRLTEHQPSLPAFLAGLIFFLNMTNPGMQNFPFFTSVVAISVSASSTLEQSDFLSSVSAASASAIPPFGSARTAFMAFMPYPF